MPFESLLQPRIGGGFGILVEDPDHLVKVDGRNMLPFGLVGILIFGGDVEDGMFSEDECERTIDDGF